MDRREAVRTIILSSTGLAAVGATMAYPQEPSRTQDPKHGAGHQGHGGGKSEANAIAQCMVSCEQGVHHCAERLGEGKKEHLASMHLLMDCASICATTAALVARQSPLAGKQLETCASACESCAAECAKHDDAMMKECVEVCKTNARLCRETSQKGGQQKGR